MSKRSRKQCKKENTLPISEPPYEKTVKLLILGDAAVGKTSLINQYVSNSFAESYISTVGIDFKEKIVPIKGRKIRMQIWDTAGQERFHNITKAYYRGAQAMAIMFDLTDHESFRNIQYWLENIEECGDKKHEKILVGGKADLSHDRKVRM